MPKKTKPKKYNRNVDEAYMTYTPQALIDLCKDCPYPLPICGEKGCEEYKALRQRLIDSNVIRGRKSKNIIGCKA